MSAKALQALRTSLEFLHKVPTRIFGSRNERLLKQYAGAVAQKSGLLPPGAAHAVPR